MGITVVRSFKGSDHFKFCMRIGPTEMELLPFASTCNNDLIPMYWGAVVRGPKIVMLQSSELLFSSCQHWHQFVVWEAIYKRQKFQSVRSENEKVKSIRRIKY